MNKFLSLIFIILCFIPGASLCSAGSQDNDSINEILDSAENLFLQLKNKKYGIAWTLLSKKSQGTIVNDVYKASRKMGGISTKEDIEQDFITSGIISQNYWKAFLTTFDPDMILKDSRWEIGFVEELKAEIIITHKKSEAPAILKIFNEDNVWKVGLVETFWTRKF